MSEGKGAKARYKATNLAAYNAALKARGSLTNWLDKDMRWYARANSERSAIEFSLTPQSSSA